MGFLTFTGGLFVDPAMIVASMTNCSGTFEGSSRWMGCYRF